MDGRLAFFGPAADAKAHFEIDHMVNLYTRLKEKPAEAWSADFAPPRTLPAAAAPAAAGAPRNAAAGRGAGPLRQLAHPDQPLLPHRHPRQPQRRCC